MLLLLSPLTLRANLLNVLSERLIPLKPFDLLDEQTKPIGGNATDSVSRFIESSHSSGSSIGSISHSEYL
jgi:hypothetical protein